MRRVMDQRVHVAPSPAYVHVDLKRSLTITLLHRCQEYQQKEPHSIYQHKLMKGRQGSPDIRYPRKSARGTPHRVSISYCFIGIVTPLRTRNVEFTLAHSTGFHFSPSSTPPPLTCTNNLQLLVRASVGPSLVPSLYFHS